MTHIYQYPNTIPNKVIISCPSCAQQAHFEFSLTLRIAKKKHIACFEASPYFDYVYDPNHLYWKHYAIFQPAFYGALDVAKFATLGDIAESYCKSSLVRNDTIGGYVCTHCLSKNSHVLDWQNDAYYKINVRSHTLWGYDRQHLVAIKQFIESNEREEKHHDYALSLYHLPTVFKTKKMRAEVLKAVTKLLEPQL